MDPARSDPAALLKAHQALGMKRTFLDLQRYDLDGLTRDIEEKQRLVVLKSLGDILKGHHDYFKEGMQFIEECQAQVHKVQEAAKKAQQDAEALAATRRATRRWLEKEAFAAMASSKTTLVSPAHSGIRDQLGQASAVAHGTEKEGKLFIASPFEPVACKINSGVFSVTKGSARPELTDLLLCTVREPREMNLLHAFQVITPTQRTTFQAMSHEEMNDWMNTIQAAISDKLNSQQSPEEKQQKAARAAQLSSLHEVAGNSHCVDCGAPAPPWVSISLGVLMCLECSGVHRAMGVHISKVRSLMLDVLDPQLMQFVKSMGNDRSNRHVWEQSLYLEAKGDSALVDPIRQALIKLDGKEQYIRAKYERREFIDISNYVGHPPSAITELLMTAIEAKDPLTVLKLVRCGADLKAPRALAAASHLVGGGGDPGPLPLHVAATVGDGVGMDVLIQNGASLAAVDRRGWTPLHYAAAANDLDAVTLLMLRGANPNSMESMGRDPQVLASSTLVTSYLQMAKDAIEEKQRKAEEKQALAARQDYERAMREQLQREAEAKKAEEAEKNSFFSRLGNFFSSDKAVASASVAVADKTETKAALAGFLKRRPSLAIVQDKGLLKK
jgi:hypothetical protein